MLLLRDIQFTFFDHRTFVLYLRITLQCSRLILLRHVQSWNRYGGIPSEAKTRAFPSVFQATAWVGTLLPWHQHPKVLTKPKIQKQLFPSAVDSIHTLLRGGMYWVVNPWGPRDFPRVKLKGNIEAVYDHSLIFNPSLPGAREYPFIHRAISFDSVKN